MRKGNVLAIDASLIFQTQKTACTEYEHSNNELFLLLKDKIKELVNCLMFVTTNGKVAKQRVSLSPDDRNQGEHLWISPRGPPLPSYFSSDISFDLVISD